MKGYKQVLEQEFCFPQLTSNNSDTTPYILHQTDSPVITVVAAVIVTIFMVVVITDRRCIVNSNLHAGKVALFFLIGFKLVLTPIEQQFAERHHLQSISRLWNFEL